MTSFSFSPLETRSITQPRRSSVDSPRSLRTSGELQSCIPNDQMPWSGLEDNRELPSHAQGSDLPSAPHDLHVGHSYEDQSMILRRSVAPGSRMDTSPDRQSPYTQWPTLSPGSAYHDHANEQHAMMGRDTGPQLSLDAGHDWKAWQQPRSHHQHQQMEPSSPSERYSWLGCQEGYRQERHPQENENEPKHMWESTKPQSRGASKAQEKLELGRQQGHERYYDQHHQQQQQQQRQPHQEHHQHQHHQHHQQKYHSQEQQYSRWQGKPLSMVSEMGELPSPTLESLPTPMSSSEPKGGRAPMSMPYAQFPTAGSNGSLARPIHERASTAGAKYHQQNGLSFDSRVIALPRTSTGDVPFSMRFRDRDGVFSFGDQSTGSAPRWPAPVPAVRKDLAVRASQSMITPSPTERGMQGRESSLLSAASPSTSPSLSSPLDCIARSASVQSDSTSAVGLESRKNSLSSPLETGEDRFVLGREGYYGENELKALFSQWQTELKDEVVPNTGSNLSDKRHNKGKARADSSKTLTGPTQGKIKVSKHTRSRTESMRASKFDRAEDHEEQSNEDDEEDEDEDEDDYGDEDEDEDDDYGMGGGQSSSAKRRASSSSSSSSSMAGRKRMKVSESSLEVSRGKREKNKAVVKNHKCEHCDKRFSRPSQLKQHIYKHTGEKPFTCDICLRNFSVSSNLKRHIRTHAANRQRQNGNRVGGSDFNARIIDAEASSSSASSSTSRKLIVHMFLPEGTSEKLVLEQFAAVVQQPSLHPRSSTSATSDNIDSTDSNINNNSSNNNNNNNNNNSSSSSSSDSSTRITGNVNNSHDSSNKEVDPSSPLLPPKNEDTDEGLA
ncbi:hypothetical protein EC968_008037 [Mortierella alpina]|nr:hypothetical protein EC968_008037 [Mortierella alpina]